MRVALYCGGCSGVLAVHKETQVPGGGASARACQHGGLSDLVRRSLQALAGSGIRAQCSIISVNYSNDRWSAGRALCVLDGKPALIDITCDSVLDVGDIIDGELLLETAEQGIFTFSDGVVLSGEVTELHSRSSDFSLLYHLGNLRSKAAERFDRIGGDEAGAYARDWC